MNLWLERDRQWHWSAFVMIFLKLLHYLPGLLRSLSGWCVCVRVRSCWWVVAEQLLGCIVESVTTDEEREKLSRTQVTDLMLISFSILFMIKILFLYKGSWKTVPCQLVGLRMWASYQLALGGSWSQACNYEFPGDCWFADSHELRSDITTVWRRLSVASRFFER